MRPTRRLPWSKWVSPLRSLSSPWKGVRARAALVGGLLAVTLLGSVFLSCASDTGTPEFTGEAAWTYLLAQCDFGPRPPGTAAHGSTLAFIANHLKSRGAEVNLQRFRRGDPYADRTMTFTNIVGSFAPDRKKRLLLAAHYDTRPWADRDPVDSLRSRPILGANDGASGVAVLLETADLLSQKLPKGLGIDLVFFDGEDYGKEGDLEHYLIGSRHFAANLGGYRPEFAIVVDMVGAADCRILQEGNSLGGAPELTREVFRRAEALDLPVFVNRVGDSIYDDHIPLLMAGIPAIDLIGWPYEHWHTLEDTPDKCSAETLRQVGVLVADIIYNFSF